ncbi:MAG TPA: diaminopimelate epimerase [Clostridiales bacterium]|nr:diaminopimelate epimerase [Clostridiales bacterium]
MRFTKMHGAGNDYVYINGFEEDVVDPAGLARFVSDRHFGIGSDGLVLILPSDPADFRMRMFNPDGSESEMCGNAIRCVGKYVYDNRMTQNKRVRVETLAGIKILDLMTDPGNQVSMVRVDMGTPELESARIPVLHNENRFIEKPVEVKGRTFSMTCVSMGNPHAVTFVEDVESFPLEEIGPLIERHPIFPARVNAEFATVLHSGEMVMRVWERGTGETLACGTGACASVAAAFLTGRGDRKMKVRLRGGDLLIEWSEENGHIFMTGPACKVYEGILDNNGRTFDGVCK